MVSVPVSSGSPPNWYPMIGIDCGRQFYSVTLNCHTIYSRLPVYITKVYYTGYMVYQFLCGYCKGALVLGYSRVVVELDLLLVMRYCM